MKLFLMLTLCWASAHIINGAIRFGLLKGRPPLKDFILIDLIGTYAFMWVGVLFSYLISYILEM